MKSKDLDKRIETIITDLKSHGPLLDQNKLLDLKQEVLSNYDTVKEYCTDKYTEDTTIALSLIDTNLDYGHCEHINPDDTFEIVFSKFRELRELTYPELKYLYKELIEEIQSYASKLNGLQPDLDHLPTAVRDIEIIKNAITYRDRKKKKQPTE